jgi:hypothetical protein
MQAMPFLIIFISASLSAWFIVSSYRHSLSRRLYVHRLMGYAGPKPASDVTVHSVTSNTLRYAQKRQKHHFALLSSGFL